MEILLVIVIVAEYLILTKQHNKDMQNSNDDEYWKGYTRGYDEGYQDAKDGKNSNNYGRMHGRSY